MENLSLSSNTVPAVKEICLSFAQLLELETLLGREITNASHQIAMRLPVLTETEIGRNCVGACIVKSNLQLTSVLVMPH